MQMYLVKITLISGSRIEWYLRASSKFNLVIRAFNKLGTLTSKEVVKIQIDEVDYPVSE
jgi:hypothetical protein